MEYYDNFPKITQLVRGVRFEQLLLNLMAYALSLYAILSALCVM